MNDLDLLQRHLNGDLDPAETAAFFERVRVSDSLRRALAEAALDEVIVSELVREPRARMPRRSWIGAAAAAALMLAALGLLLFAPAAGPRYYEGHAVFNLGQARVELDGDAIVEGGRVLLGRGTLHAVGQVEIGTSRVVVRVNGEADLIVGAETIVEVRAGTARLRHAEAASAAQAGDVEIASGRYAVLDGGSARLIGRAKVAEAVARGAAFLETRRREIWSPIADGHRNGPAPQRSYAELALLAFRRAGYAPDHPVVADLVGRATTRPFESTYIAALQAMALDPAAHRERLRECARVLERAQARNGQWDYAVAPVAPSGDNSVSAYAALGLRACADAGIQIESSVLDRARRWWTSSQNPDGGWGYADAVNATQTGDAGTGNASYGSATAGALAALAALGGGEEAVAKGVAWLAANFSADRNPAKAAGFCQVHWYAMCGRAGRGLRTETFGAREWYPEIADLLLAAQRPDGAWLLERGQFMGRERNEILDTCLAMIFLSR
jgi:hypothetical protein